MYSSNNDNTGNSSNSGNMGNGNIAYVTALYVQT